MNDVIKEVEDEEKETEEVEERKAVLAGLRFRLSGDTR